MPPDPEALKAIAHATGGESFTALDESTLKRVYDHIGTRVSSTKQQKELTFLVAGLAAVLLAAAAGSSWAAEGRHDVRRSVSAGRAGRHPARADRRTSCSRAAAAAPMRAAANPALWPNLMPRRPGWRRHVPPALLLLALAALLVGVARPQALMASDQKETTVVLAVDSSNSMAAKDVDPSRIAAARTAARDLIAGLPVNAKLGLVSFARDVRVLQAPTDDRAAFNNALAHLKLRGGTTLGTAIDRAVASLRASHPALKGRAIIVISDGKSTEGTRSPIAAARAAKAVGVRVFTVSLGTAAAPSPSRARPSACRPTRRRCGASPPSAAGASTAPPTPRRCRHAYSDIGSAVRPQHKKRDISFAFVGGAMALVAGAACSRWPGSAACSDRQSVAHLQAREALGERGREQRAMAVGGIVLDAQQADAASATRPSERIDGRACRRGEGAR